MPLLHQLIHAGKGVVALAAALLLAWRAASDFAWSRPVRLREPRVQLALLGVAAVLAWTNFGYFHFASVIHPHDIAHNYLGAKYSRELGYTELYRCVARAEAELGRPPSRHTAWARDLRTNQLAPVDALGEHDGRCERFSEARWSAFVEDVGRLREGVPRARRGEFYRDHGFNGSPVGVALAGWLTSVVPSTRAGLVTLVLLDWLLLALAATIIARTFGWQVLALALVWFGTCYATRYHFTGGGVLRNDWLLLTVAAIALVRTGRTIAGGAAVAWAALLKIFPAVLGVGLALHWLGAIRSGPATRVIRGVARPMLGALLAASILVGAASLWASDGALDFAPFAAFKANTERLLEGPFTNRVGLKALLSWRPASRMTNVGDYWMDAPGDIWREQQRENLARLAWLFWALLAAFATSLAVAAARNPAWVAMVLALGLVPIALESSARYYGFMMAYAFLWPLRPWVGTALAALSFGTLVSPALFHAQDDAFAFTSLLVVIFVATVTTSFAWSPSHDKAE